jgi:hypothetical protein
MHTPPAQLLLAQSAAWRQVSPSGQALQPGSFPPQSMSLSLPFRWLSSQEKLTQTPPWQLPLRQSRSNAQESETAQRSQPRSAPPQSTSVSPALRSPSSQDTHAPWTQLSLAQSLSAWQVSPSGQRWQLASLPPQSTLDSSPFNWSSSHDGGAWQLPWLHTPLLQSEPALHALPGAQPGHVPPPQSVSSSSPLRTSSLHEASTVQSWAEGEQNEPATQSSSDVQAASTSQLAEQLPPQSTSVSS